jgi:putative restriction endonuclease
MARYWWVNHKQTSREEIGGGYLWSPKAKRDGSPNLFYDNMRRAEPGDYVLSYASGQIAHVGLVCDFAFSRIKPDEFGSAGNSWDNEGWMLPILWRPLSNRIVPKTRFEQIRELLPTKYSPLSLKTGHGNQAVYLAEISQQLFSELLGIDEIGLETLFGPASYAIYNGLQASLTDEQIQERIKKDISLSSTEKAQQINARRGQGLFRENVMHYETSCRLTGISSPQLLIASHIKPWRSCENGFERLDGNNGLLLSPNVDLLFDRGFIGFAEDGHVIISPHISSHDLTRLGLGAVIDKVHAPFRPAQLPYLAYHRQNVLLT